ncbi:MAG: universal stress protein [Terriglobia bacterium]
MEKRKVMVALRDTSSAPELVTLACEMAAAPGSEVIALHVIEVPIALDLSAESEVLEHPGKEILLLARQVAAENSEATIKTRLVRARQAGFAIVDEAKEFAADLLIIGCRGHHGLAEAIFGSTVHYLAQNSPCRVIVQIQPARKH